MIVECYSADVYCDHPNHSHLHGYPASTYSGPNKTDTDKQLRKAGWKRKNGMDICPECMKRLNSGKNGN